MIAWQRVSVVGPSGALRTPGQLADELRAGRGGVLLTGHLFGRVAPYARLLSRHLGGVGRPWAVQSEVSVGGDASLLRLARDSGCRALVIGPEPDPLMRVETGAGWPRLAVACLRRIRRVGLLTVVHCTLGCPGDDAGIFGRSVRFCIAARVTFPQLVPHEGPGPMSRAELAQGLAWARRALHTHRGIWRRSGILGAERVAALFANYRARRVILADPPFEATPAMRLARALAHPIRIRERVPFVSTLVGAVHAGSGQVRSAWLRARAVRDEKIAALVIRLEGTVDARAARKLVLRVRRAIGGTRERIVVDLAGVERVSLTVLTRFLEEHASRLAELRGRLAFRNLRPALAALRRNLHGMLPNSALLEHALEEAS